MAQDHRAPGDQRPTAEEMLDRVRLAERSQGRAWLRVYLGYAPGVGKTYAMLHEVQRRQERGTDVVVGWVEPYDRPHTIAAIGDLEAIPRRQIEYQGVPIEEMDVDAIIARRPQGALQIRDAGINVITTVNVQHLESLKDTIKDITGIRIRETLPDWVIDDADEVEMVDMSPEALQKRMTHGNVYPPSRVNDALQHFFREGNLSALRELARDRRPLALPRDGAGLCPAD